MPNIARAILLVNPSNPELAGQPEMAQQAARALGWQLQVVAADSETGIDAAFAAARTHGGNDYKPELGKRTLVRALLQAAQLSI